MRVDPAHNPTKHPALDLVVGLAGVNEGIEFAAVSVEVDVVLDLVALVHQIMHQFLDCRNHRVQGRVGVPGPLAVGV